MLRWGVGFVFLWFGIDKFVHPAYWPMWVPEFLPALRTPTAITAFGAFEIAIGLALLANVRVREVSAVATLFMTAIVATSGLAPVVRDVGLIAAAAYLTLTTPGPTPASRARHRSAFRWNARYPVLLAAICTLVVLGVALAVGSELAWAPEPPAAATGQLLTFQEPVDGAQLPAGDVQVTVRVSAEARRIIANHVHFKVDGRVVDAVFLQNGDTEAATVLRSLGAGEHEISAYLAYADHTEHAGSRTTVRVRVSE